MDIGLIGLGVMGQNLAYNITRNNTLGVFNRTSEKTKALCNTIKENIKPCYSLSELIESLKKPRVVLVLVQSGAPVDAMLSELADHLDKDDVIIDLGNSQYEDTTRRCNDYKNRFKYVGCGISGGEYGARYGPSLMPGGDVTAWPLIKDIFQKVAARDGDNVCCQWIGADGSGHFVKMIHNGIEYGNMAIISEICTVLKCMKMSNDQIADLFEQWNVTEKNYLYEITAKVFRKKIDGNFVIDSIDDRAENKGTGLWSVIAAMDCQYQAKTMADAIFARIISNDQTKRLKFSKQNNEIKKEIKLTTSELKETLDLSITLSYIQGMSLIKKMSLKHNWNIQLQNVCRVWKNGCIIRSKLLNVIEEIMNEEDFENSKLFIDIYKKNIKGLRNVVLESIKMEIPLITINGSLNYLDMLKEENGPGNVIQALRDYFGAHQVLIRGEKEYKHIEWE
ncbi:hypothetical protein COBT_002220 [Conglomerata obtusa]